MCIGNREHSLKIGFLLEARALKMLSASVENLH
jgi:hypothetical protein